MGIKEILKQLDRDLRWLSKTTKIPYSTLNDLVNGRVNLKKCKQSNIRKIAMVLGISDQQMVDVIMGMDFQYKLDYYYLARLFELDLTRIILARKQNSFAESMYWRIRGKAKEAPMSVDNVNNAFIEIQEKGELCESGMIDQIANYANLTFEEVLEYADFWKRVNSRFEREKDMQNKKNIFVDFMTQEEIVEKIKEHNSKNHNTKYIKLKELNKYYTGIKNIREMPIGELKMYANATGLGLGELYSYFCKNGACDDVCMHKRYKEYEKDTQLLISDYF